MLWFLWSQTCNRLQCDYISPSLELWLDWFFRQCCCRTWSGVWYIMRIVKNKYARFICKIIWLNCYLLVYCCIQWKEFRKINDHIQLFCIQGLFSYKTVIFYLGPSQIKEWNEGLHSLCVLALEGFLPSSGRKRSQNNKDALPSSVCRGMSVSYLQEAGKPF